MSGQIPKAEPSCKLISACFTAEIPSLHQRLQRPLALDE